MRCPTGAAHHQIAAQLRHAANVIDRARRIREFNRDVDSLEAVRADTCAVAIGFRGQDQTNLSAAIRGKLRDCLSHLAITD